MGKIKFITSNKHKYEEFIDKVEKRGFLKYEFIHQQLEYLEIQADTTIEIALHSATSLTPILGSDFLIEDSGLYVNELEGFPGPYSSYIYGSIKPNGILKILGQSRNRAAKFYSVIVFIDQNKQPHTFLGEMEGTISIEMKGNHGFGFDPIFIPKGFDKTLAQMSLEEKNKISHRSKSVNNLLEYLETYY